MYRVTTLVFIIYKMSTSLFLCADQLSDAFTKLINGFFLGTATSSPAARLSPAFSAGFAEVVSSSSVTLRLSSTMSLSGVAFTSVPGFGDSVPAFSSSCFCKNTSITQNPTYYFLNVPIKYRNFKQF